MISFTVRKRGMTPKVAKRVLNGIHRDAMHNLGVQWHANYRELHFKNLASARYGYTPRAGERGRPAKRFDRSYTGRKLKQFGHTRPLVLTGESEQATRQLDVRATAKRGTAQVKIVLHAPKLNFRYRGSPIDMRAELTTVIPEEAEALSQATSDFLSQRYGSVQAATVEQIQ